MIGEDCDDGNLIDGDGCSSTCTRDGLRVHPGVHCERLAGQCVLRVAALFRDFSERATATSATMPAMAWRWARWRQTRCQRAAGAGGQRAAACLSTAANFAEWYSHDHSPNSTLVGEVLLVDDDADGAYVNRYGANGEKW